MRDPIKLFRVVLAAETWQRFSSLVAILHGCFRVAFWLLLLPNTVKKPLLINIHYSFTSELLHLLYSLSPLLSPLPSRVSVDKSPSVFKTVGQTSSSLPSMWAIIHIQDFSRPSKIPTVRKKNWWKHHLCYQAAQSSSQNFGVSKGSSLLSSPHTTQLADKSRGLEGFLAVRSLFWAASPSWVETPVCQETSQPPVIIRTLALPHR